jgi:hypothetical protein
MNPEPDPNKAQVDVLRRLRAETAAELDALLPALLDRAWQSRMRFGRQSKPFGRKIRRRPIFCHGFCHAARGSLVLLHVATR